MVQKTDMTTIDPNTPEAAESLLRRQGLDILSDAAMEAYNETRFFGGAMNPEIDTDVLNKWEVHAGMMKRQFFVSDPSKECRGLRRTAWYYPEGVAGGDGSPVIVLEDENDQELPPQQLTQIDDRPKAE